jgi:phosphonoacetaldehyde hydrolase
MNPRAVIFDWAGTTVDHGSRAPILSFMHVFREHGISVSEKQARVAMGRDKWTHIQQTLQMEPVARSFVESYGRPSQDSDVDALHETFKATQVSLVAAGCEPISGIVPMVQQLLARGIRVGSTTGYSRAIMDALMPLAAERGYTPECCMTADDGPAGRPAPWMLFRACEVLGVFPVSGVIVVDDTVVGIQAARNAGMVAVGVAATGNLVGLGEEELAQLPNAERELRVGQARVALLEAGAHLVIDSAASLLEHVIDNGAWLSR